MNVIEKGMKDLSTSLDAIRLQGRLDGIEFSLLALKESGYNARDFMDKAVVEVDRIGEVLKESMEKITEEHPISQ